MKLYAVLPFILQLLAWPVAHFIFNITGSFKVTGREHLKDLNGPFIFASNHLNELDPVLQRAMRPMFSNPVFWVARTRDHYTWKGWRRFLYGEWFFRSWGAYPAYKGVNDYEKSLRHHIKILNDGYSVCIFPQGLKAKEQGIDAPVHGGAAYLASKTGVPIVPVTIKGTLHLDAQKLFFGSPQLRITFGTPIHVSKPESERDEQYYKKHMKTVIESIYETI